MRKESIILIIVILVLSMILPHGITPSHVVTGTSKVAEPSITNIRSSSTSPDNATDINYVSYSPKVNDQYPVSDGVISTDNAVILTWPADQTVDLNSAPITLSWDVSRNQQSSTKPYSIYINGTVPTGGSGTFRTTDTISYLFDPTQGGVFNVTLYITDDFASDVHTTFITVKQLLHFVTEPGNLTFSIGPTQNQIQWSMGADSPGQYWLYKNSSLLVSSTWQNDIPITAYMPNLVADIGIYNYTIVVTDTPGNKITSKSYITITSGPALQSKTAKLVFDNETSPISLYWTFSSSTTTSKYVVYNTSTNALITSGTWTSSQKIFYNITSLPIGNYSYSMYVNDTASKFTWSNITLRIDDRPTFDSFPMVPANISEETILPLIWNARTLNPKSYNIRINGTLVYSGVWASFVDISYNFSNYLKATYNLTIELFDYAGLSRSNSVIIIVVDSLSPVFLSSTDSGTYSYLTPHIYYNLSLFDQHPENYQVKMNDQVIATGLWESSLSYEFFERNVGTYSLTFIFYDQSGNSVSTTKTITIVDTIAPQLTLSPVNSSVMVYETIQLNWSYSDINPTNYVITTNSSDISGAQGIWTGDSNITYDLTPTEVGMLALNITVFDQSGNSMSNIVILDVFPVHTKEPMFTNLSTLNTVYSGDTQILNGVWLTAENNSISDATINGTLRNTVNSTIETTPDFTTSTDGEFHLNLTYSDLQIGNYEWKVSFSKFQYINQTFRISITIEWHVISYIIDYGSSLTQNKDFDVIISMNYDDSSQSLHTNAVSKHGPASGIEFNLNFYVLYLSKDSVVQHKFSGTTGADGSKVITLSAKDTSNIREIDHLEFNLSGNQNLQLNGNTIIENLDLKVNASNPTNWFELEFGFNPMIIVLILFLIFLNPIFKRMQIMFSKISKLSAKRRFRYFYEMSTIKTILIFNNNGILFYVNQFSRDASLDPSLIAGLSSAITSFLGEIDNAENEYGFHKMEKQDLSITIHSGQYSSVAVLSSIDLTDEIKSNLAEIHKELETEFVREFERGIGNFGTEDDKKIQAIFTKWDLHVPLLTGVTFDRTEIVEIHDSGELSTLIRVELGNLLNKSQGELDGKTFSFNELVIAFTNYGLEPELSSKIIYDLYIKGGFL